MAFPTSNLDNAFTLNEKPAKKNSKKQGKEENTDNKGQFIINFEKIVAGKDKRTTLMIRNIPNKYTVSSLLEEINSCFEGKLDFLYLPLDYKNNCNLGFAFINFTHHHHILLFHDLFYGKKWKKYNSVKKCDLTYAKFQGKKELTSHFENITNSNNLVVPDDKKPVILTPPNPQPKIEVSLHFLELFKKYYKNLQYDTISTSRFVIKALFWN